MNLSEGKRIQECISDARAGIRRISKSAANEWSHFGEKMPSFLHQIKKSEDDQIQEKSGQDQEAMNRKSENRLQDQYRHIVRHF